MLDASIDYPRSDPWIRGRLRYPLTPCLCAWSAGDRARMERVLPALLTMVGLASGYSAHVDLYHVFHWLWPERRTECLEMADGQREYLRPPPVMPKDVVGMARRVVQACYDNPSIWIPPIGNTNSTFRDVGLPETRAGLKNLLAGIPS